MTDEADPWVWKTSVARRGGSCYHVDPDCPRVPDLDRATRKRLSKIDDDLPACRECDPDTEIDRSNANFDHQRALRNAAEKT